ncbi:hypothetical protein [Micromonospora sp. NBC_01813]|uniref:hypothetical protein n=1 Tax=Micromonospora sp. NBC_01813 TaxID=2975988 RepID=UPI002DDAB141|nr:hypothetical protein [Micromonospora sp. NBC_01813]WSA12040.1 hypothetical protein OG958_15370 [Micromonospora sp. NBC_01813]
MHGEADVHPIRRGPARPTPPESAGHDRRDVWEVVKFLREIDERGPSALSAAAEVFALDANRIASAVNYYGDYRAEIDAADEVSERAEQAWRIQQRLIA